MKLRSQLKTLCGIAFMISSIAFPLQFASAQIAVDSRLTLSGECRNCDLSSRNISRLSLHGANYTGSNFTGSNLSGGELTKTDLSGAQFARAYLMRTSGEKIVMRQARFTDAVLIEARFIHSDISGADLRHADLSRGTFHGSDFSESVLENTEAQNADFTGANLSLAKMGYGHFQNAIFNDATMKFTDFGRANVSNASFENTNLTGADLRFVRGLTQDQIVTACGSPSTRLPLSTMTLKPCKTRADAESWANMHAGQRVSVPDSDYSLSKKDLALSIRGIDRAILALPEDAYEAKAELKATRKRLKKMHDRL